MDMEAHSKHQIGVLWFDDGSMKGLACYINLVGLVVLDQQGNFQRILPILGSRPSFSRFCRLPPSSSQMLALPRSLTARFPWWSNRTRIPRPRRSRALEITGACPAPGRFFSELLTLHKRASDFQRYQVSLSTHFPNGKTDSKSRLHFSAANALVQRFPSCRWLVGICFPRS